MSAYLIANYKITNAEAYAAYPPAVTKTLQDCGAEIVVADFDSEVMEGSGAAVSIVLRFESMDAARAWYASEAYQSIVHHRSDNSEGMVVFARGAE